MSGTLAAQRPAAVGTVELVYFARIPALTAAQPVNWLITKAPDVYLYGVLLEAMLFQKDEASAAQLGLSDGHLWRVQGGARVGYETMIGNTRLTTILTGLAYENTTITGGFIQGGAFGSNTLALNDQGKLRGQAILTFAADHGNGWSTFIQGNVRGGDEYFAAGGRAGFRYGF